VLVAVDGFRPCESWGFDCDVVVTEFRGFAVLTILGGFSGLFGVRVLFSAHIWLMGTQQYILLPFYLHWCSIEYKELAGVVIMTRIGRSFAKKNNVLPCAK